MSVNLDSLKGTMSKAFDSAQVKVAQGAEYVKGKATLASNKMGHSFRQFKREANSNFQEFKVLAKHHTKRGLDHVNQAKIVFQGDMSKDEQRVVLAKTAIVALVTFTASPVVVGLLIFAATAGLKGEKTKEAAQKAIAIAAVIFVTGFVGAAVITALTFLIECHKHLAKKVQAEEAAKQAKEQQDVVAQAAALAVDSDKENDSDYDEVERADLP